MTMPHASPPPPRTWPQAQREVDQAVAIHKAPLMYARFAFFMSELRDDTGRPLIVADHHEEWCDLMQNYPLLCLLAPRDHGKRLDVATPIPTPTGWTTMGDLVAGDELFDERGQVCRVTVAHPVEDGDSYRVTFDDGTSVLADAEHLWLTWDKAARASANRRGWPHDHGSRIRVPPAVRTTADIRASLRVGREHNHSVPLPEPLQCPEADLPIEPYLLGVWAGDGFTRSGALALFEPEMVELVTAAGAVLRPRKDPHVFAVEGLTSSLRAEGLLGRKHIPAAYLRASVEQRRALLAGLMDTDGHAARDGTVEYTTTVEALADGVYELAVSLGFKPRVYRGRATLYGRDCGPKWRLCWSPRGSVFRLARKQARVDAHPQRGWRTQHRFIVAVEPVESVSMRCITVDSPSHLYLAGPQMVPTHNTYTEVSYILWRIWKHNRDPKTGLLREGNPEGRFQAVLFSDTIPQAEVFFDLLQSLLLGNEPIFGDLFPSVHRGGRDVWSKRRVRLGNGAEVFIRGYRTSTRGLHPDLIVLDDVLNDENTMTAYQREKTWRYFVATLLPMNARQYIVVGCLATDTPVLMADGTWRPIQRVEVGEEVWAPNTRGEFNRRKVQAVLDQGVAETVDVVTDRATVRATPWHPFLVAAGRGNWEWRRADALRPGDRVVEVKEVPGQLDHPWMDEEFCWLMGYLMGDGWVASDRRSIWASLGVDQSVNDRVVAALRDWMPAVNFSVVPFGPGRGGYVKGDNRAAAAALADLGLSGKATTKRLPDWLFRAPPEHRRAFLRGIGAADGHRVKRSTETYRIEMANEALIRDLRSLAMTSGVRAGRIRSRTRTQQAPNSPAPTTSTTWDIGLNLATAGRSEGKHRGVGRMGSRKLGSHLRFARVIEVRKSGPTQVWDLTVEGTHSFIADGLGVHNTAMHYDDLLHRLKPDKSKAPMVVRNRKTRFRWVRYKSVNWETKQVLWSRQHSYDDLLGRRDQQPVIFAREWQNDPVDDTASLFPWTLTAKALNPGTDLHPETFLQNYRKSADEVIVLGADFALSESVGADYCVVMVAAVNRWTMKRRILYAVREKGWGFQQQVDILRFACLAFGVDLGVMEENSFQTWVHGETKKYPETAGRILGHRTGAEKSNLAEGVPSMKVSLTQELWSFPTGDEASRRFAQQWQAEMSAFGWFNDKLQGVGEHDDTVMAFWLLDRAVRRVLEWLAQGPAEEVIHGEQVGINPVRIGEDY